jgi:hypothetical protein
MTDKLKFIQLTAVSIGLQPLDYRMAKYIHETGAKNADDLKEILLSDKQVEGIGRTTTIKLKGLLGIEVPARTSWKKETERLQKLLDDHKIKY